MAYIFVTALLVLVWQVALKRTGVPQSWRRVKVPIWMVWLGAALLPLGFAAQLVVVGYASRNEQLHAQPWFSELPLHLVETPLASPPGTYVAIGIFVSVLVQTAGLILLSIARPDRFNRSAPYVTGIVLALLAILSPVISEPDIIYYAYVSTIGLTSYFATSVPVSSPYHFLVGHIPLTGNIYGPLWTGFAVFIGSFGRSLHDKLIAFRVANAVLIVCAALTIRAMRYSRSVQIAFALNPMLWFFFVVDGHNDIFPTTLCLLAIAAARRYPAAAMALVASAGLYKISFLLTGSFVFLRTRSRRGAILMTAATVLIALLLSWLVAGHEYFANLAGFTHKLRGTADTTVAVKVVSAAMTLAVLGFTGIALLARRMHPAAAWLFPLASPAPLPWYLSWGLPYAAVVRRGFLETLLLLPLGGALGDRVFATAPIICFVMYATFVFVTTDLLFSALQGLRSRNHHEPASIPSSRA